MTKKQQRRVKGFAVVDGMGQIVETWTDEKEDFAKALADLRVASWNTFNKRVVVPCEIILALPHSLKGKIKK